MLEPLEAVEEYRTPDGTRIDLAVPEKGLAIEFENSYKWINRRVLYNAVKAKRGGFKNLVMIYPFNDKSIKRSWVNSFIEELGVNLVVMKPDKIKDIKRNLFKENY
ncbi:hypothetical protein GF352_03785 [archaeon]|nr:hypothetical protein [archaeon]